MFLVKDPEIASNVGDKLAKTPFESKENFVKWFNAGLINKSNDTILSIVRELKAGYKDVVEVGGQIQFLETDEILADEIITAVRNWGVLVSVRRELRALLSANVVNVDQRVLVNDEVEKGAFLTPNQDGILEKIPCNRCFRNQQELTAACRQAGIDAHPDEDGNLSISVRSIVECDSSFISRMHMIIPQTGKYTE